MQFLVPISALKKAGLLMQASTPLAGDLVLMLIIAHLLAQAPQKHLQSSVNFLGRGKPFDAR
jgi:hypothetical protein